jgi:hypothetical protein
MRRSDEGGIEAVRAFFKGPTIPGCMGGMEKACQRDKRQAGQLPVIGSEFSARRGLKIRGSGATEVMIYDLGRPPAGGLFSAVCRLRPPTCTPARIRVLTFGRGGLEFSDDAV